MRNLWKWASLHGSKYRVALRPHVRVRGIGKDAFL
jgi:hypothetical protein